MSRIVARRVKGLPSNLSRKRARLEPRRLFREEGGLILEVPGPPSEGGAR